MKTDNLPPLAPGSVAVRFRVEWRGRPARPVVVGLQAVWVVEVVGDCVTWTNATRSKFARGEFRHTSHRRELFTVDALDGVTAAFLSALAFEISEPAAPAENPASFSLPGDGAAGYGPRRRVAPWYRRDVDGEPDFAGFESAATNAPACTERAGAPFQSR
jgi:hypothetical protein